MHYLAEKRDGGWGGGRQALRDVPDILNCSHFVNLHDIEYRIFGYLRSDIEGKPSGISLIS